ncbi:MAG: TIGR00730 family Rossman fold protein [Halobacteriovoraceae bacterium]|nr:TIGR00730 family Rossman fold protein [Halobacteriovoraceae bacterium]|tara:strand:+ start:10864 stop:11469 length:606 start_codon:yes stop_codon:yes gene_type:complete
MQHKKIGVMCGSSDACPEKFLTLAYQVGQELARHELDIIYGGGAKGLMRRVADGGLEAGAQVHGYMPEFMIAVEWQHTNLSELHITQDMSERKYRMMSESDATIFLPGGCGTMEEFFEWLSCKRLGKYIGPLVIFNFEGYYDPLIKLLENMEANNFHNPEHKQMFSVCTQVEDLVATITSAPSWSADAIQFASVRHASKER